MRKKISFIIDGARVGWVNASGLDCNSSKIANLGTPTLSTDGATKGYADTLDGQNVKLTGDQTITGIKIFNGSRNDIRALTLLSQADFNNVDIINGGNITYNGARILNQNGGDIFFSQTTGDWQSFLYTLNTDSSGTADQRGYLFTNVAFDVKGAGLYISKLLDNKSASSDIVRFNNAGGKKFYGALDMNSNNITSGGTITGTTITGTTITASTKITTATGKPIIIGSATKGTGPSAGLEIYGAFGDFTAGPHIQAITTEDTYPVFTIANLGHNNIILAFDAYLDNAGWKSSYANANFRIAKVSNTLSFGYKSGIAVGSAITWSEAMNISNAGLITANAGISVVNSTADIRGEARTGSHATPVGLYVTGNLGQSSGGVEFRHSNGTQGVGFGYNPIYATGSNTNQDLNIYARGTGIIYTQNATSCPSLTIPATSSGSLRIRQRPASTNDIQLYFTSGGNANYGVVTSSGGLLHAWSTSNSTTGEPSGNYVYIPLGGNWTYTSDRRLKSDIKTLDCGDCCEKLMKINCCSYYSKSDEKKEKKNHGFIADEVKKVFPEFVSESGIKADDGKGNLEGITYTDFIPILVSAFQHVAEKVVTSIDVINNLEKENKTLLNILQDLTNQLAEIRAVLFPPNA